MILYVEGNSAKLCTDTLHSPEETENMHLRGTVLPNELENKLLHFSTRKPYSCQINQQYKSCLEQSTKDFRTRVKQSHSKVIQMNQPTRCSN